MSEDRVLTRDQFETFFRIVMQGVPEGDKDGIRRYNDALEKLKWIVEDDDA